MEACVRIEQGLSRPLWFACRHHVYEIILRPPSTLAPARLSTSSTDSKKCGLTLTRLKLKPFTAFFQATTTEMKWEHYSDKSSSLLNTSARTAKNFDRIVRSNRWSDSSLWSIPNTDTKLHFPTTLHSMTTPSLER